MKLSTREKRLAILGSAVVIGIAIYYASAHVVPSGDGLGNAVEIKKRMLLRERETIAREDEFKARLEGYRTRLKEDMGLLLPMDNPSIASAELQKVISDMATQNGVEILRKDIQREQKLQNGIVKVSAKIETNCAPEQLVQFLSAIQNYAKALTVDDLTINSFRIQKKYEIRPSITVSALIHAPEEAKPAPKAAGAP